MSRVRRYQNPDLYEQLSAEYVLGTLHGRALKRFKKLLAERPYIQYSVDNWEKRFNSLGELQTEVKPSAAVWKNIKSEIMATQEPASAQQSQSDHKSGGLLARPGFWQAATAVMSLMLTVAILLPMQNNSTDRVFHSDPTFVAILESNANKPMMVTTGIQDKGLVNVRMREMPDIPQNEDWVLWAIPKNGAAPVQLGVLQRNSMQTDLRFTRDQWKEKVKDVEMFGVTSEQRGGMGQPGKEDIMYKGKCLEFT